MSTKSLCLTSLGPVKGTKSDGDQRYDCPFCQGQAKFEVSWRRGLYYCHKCGQGGRAKGRGYSQGHSKHQKKPVGEYAPATKESLMVRYLRESRGLPWQLVDALEPHTGPHPLAVYFPLHGTAGSSELHYQGRVVVDGLEPKYLNSYGLRKSEVLWGPREPSKHLVVCEGIFDAVWGSNRVALLGKILSDHQALLLRSMNPDRITVFLDSEAQVEAAEIGLKLSQYCSCRIYKAQCPIDQDPDSLRAEGETLINTASRLA